MYWLYRIQVQIMAFFSQDLKINVRRSIVGFTFHWELSSYVSERANWLLYTQMEQN